MKRQIKIVIDKYTNQYVRFLEKRFDVTILEPESRRKPDLFVFTGGADVSPEYYGEDVGIYTGTDKTRDIRDFSNFNKAKDNHIPMLGICRGSQFLCVANEGKLIQHVSGHAMRGTHKITTPRGIFDITSTHHQMMFPFGLPKNNYNIIARSSKKNSILYLNGDNKSVELPKTFVEPEIVKFPLTNSLAIQGHPEMNHCPENTVNYCLDLIDDIIKI